MGHLFPGGNLAHIRQRVSLPGDFSFDVAAGHEILPFSP
jgi:hypothetical protein